MYRSTTSITCKWNRRKHFQQNVQSRQPDNCRGEEEEEEEEYFEEENSEGGSIEKE